MIKTFLIVALLLTVSGIGQTIDSLISKKQCGYITCRYAKNINKKTGYSYHYVSLSFQNQSYETITDIGSIFILEQSALDTLISDLDSIKQYIGTTVNITYQNKYYRLSHDDITPDWITISDEDGKWTYFPIEKGLTIFIEWLRAIQFPE